VPDPIVIAVVLLTLALTAVTFYFGFVTKTLGRTRLQGLFFLCLALMGLEVFDLYRVARAPVALARYVTPYASVNDWVYVPRLPGQRGRTWLFSSPDPPDRIRSFYRDERNRPGWRVLEETPLTMERMGLRFVIIVTGDARAGSRILYEVSDPSP
jgi:hypothetical protein